MVSKERLAILYQETDDKINKEKIFKEIYSKLEREAYELCHYYKDFLYKFSDKDIFFEEALQESKLCLVKCIDKFDASKNTKLSTFYRTCLANHLSDVYRGYIKINKNELIDTSVFNWLNTDTENDIVSKFDNKKLYDLFNYHLEKIHYSKPIHKKIFKEYLGFVDDADLLSKESFGTIGERYNLSRMAIKKIVDKYFELLKNSLKRSGDLDKIQEYL